jgi:hypothetical protein
MWGVIMNQQPKVGGNFYGSYGSDGKAAWSVHRAIDGNEQEGSAVEHSGDSEDDRRHS